MIRKRHSAAILTLAIGLLVFSGCAHLRLPAIDPSGRRIFLPAPTTTRILTHAERAHGGLGQIHRVLHGSGGLVHGDRGAVSCLRDLVDCKRNCDQSLANLFHPRSAFPSPPSPSRGSPAAPAPLVQLAPPTPPLVQRLPNTNPFDGLLSARNWMDECGPGPAVTLQPRNLTVPVSETVVLIGGVCDGEGFYRTRQPVEWLLSKNGVGYFVDPSERSRTVLNQVFGKTNLGPELICRNQAVGETTNAAHILTNRTYDPCDDTLILKGQSWITLRSDKEGTSHVTLIAPELEDCKSNRQTAVIKWIDGQADLPPPAISPAGQPQTLTTTVVRANGTPVQGWQVRYTIADGVPATFVSGSREATVTTDAMGRAAVTIVPQGTVQGTTNVDVQVIRPPSSTREASLIIQQGRTSVTWGQPVAPDLTVRLEGPEQLRLNLPVHYTIRVANLGDGPAEHVVVSDMIPNGLQLVSSDPRGQLTGNRVEWQVGRLEPGQEQTIDVEFRPTRSGNVRHCVLAASADGAIVEDCLTSNVAMRALFIEMEGPTTQVEVGEEARYRVTVTNRGDRRLTNITVVDRFDEGLEHAEAASPIERSLGNLEPNESTRFGVTFTPRQPGRLCHQIEASAPGTETVSAEHCLQAIKKVRRELTIRKTGPDQMSVGQVAAFYILLENKGDVPLRVQVEDMYDPELQPISASPPLDAVDGRLAGVIPSIAPGQSLTLQVDCRAEQDAPNACSRARALFDDEEIEAEKCLPILPGIDPSRPRDDRPIEPDLDRRLPIQPRDGGRGPDLGGDRFRDDGALRMSVRQRGSSWRVGETVNYFLVIRNDRPVSDKDIRLTVRLPSSMDFEGINGYVAPMLVRDGVIQMEPIAELRSGEQVEFAVTTVAREPGETEFRAEVTSERASRPIVVVEPTTILAR